MLPCCQWDSQAPSLTLFRSEHPRIAPGPLGRMAFKVWIRPLQVAVREAQVIQCGHCAPGMIMAAKALLDRTPRPTEAQVRQILEEHECMCGSRGQVIRTVLRLAGK